MSNSTDVDREDVVIRCELFVPGRLCIVGEHTDWAAKYRSQNPNISCGYTLVCATNHGLYAKVTSRTDNTLRFIYTANEGSFSGGVWKLEVDELTLAAKTGGFFSYVAGTAAYIIQHPKYITQTTEHNTTTNTYTTTNCITSPSPKGLLIHNYKTTLPMKKGLSSSAAVCVLVARAFNEIYDLQLTQEELMEIAFQGEMLTPSQCGRMDQCVVMGPGAVGLMEFTGEGCSLRQLLLPAATLPGQLPHAPACNSPGVIQPPVATPSEQILISDVDTSISSGSSSGSSSDPSSPPTTEDNTTAATVVSAEKGLFFVVVDLGASKDTVKILGDLNACFPYPSNPTQELMHNYVNEMKTITNNAVSAIERHDIHTLATMMTISQKYFDEYCQPNCNTELKSPYLHTLMNDMKLKTISLAVKGVGSQGDGSAQILCKDSTQQIEVLEYVKHTYNMEAFTLTIPLCSD